jgi:hypothetical protein
LAEDPENKKAMSANQDQTGADGENAGPKITIPINRVQRNELLLLLHYAAAAIPRVRVRRGSREERHRVIARMREGLDLLLRGAVPPACTGIALSEIEGRKAFEFLMMLGVLLATDGTQQLTETWGRWLEVMAEAVVIPIPAMALPGLAEWQSGTADSGTLSAYERIRQCPDGEFCDVSVADITRLGVWLQYLDTRDGRVEALIGTLDAIMEPMHSITARLKA